MRKFVLFFMGLISSMVFACKCEAFGAIGIQFHEAQFVGEIEILKIYGNNQQGRTYKADVNVLKLYKGSTIKTIDVSGLIDDIESAACETKLKQREKYLIYLSKNDGEKIISMTSRGNNSYKTENYLVTSCTPKVYISDFEDDKLKLERKVDDFLSKNPDELSQVFFFDKSESENSKGVFKNYILNNPKNRFAVFKLKVNGKSEVDNVEAIQNFGSEQDDEILLLIKKNFAIIRGFFEEVKNEEVLLTLFYLPKNKDVEFKETIGIRLE